MFMHDIPHLYVSVLLLEKYIPGELVLYIPV